MCPLHSVRPDAEDVISIRSAGDSRTMDSHDDHPSTVVIRFPVLLLPVAIIMSHPLGFAKLDNIRDDIISINSELGG